MSGRHIDLGQYSSPYMLNVNGDEWPDVLIAYQVTEDPGKPLNRIAYFHGINENEFQLESLDYGNLSEVLSEGFRPYLTAGDVDGDNDLDLLIGVSNGGSYLIQNGSGKNDAFVVESINKDWAGLSMLDGATPELYDIDRDGDLDVIAGNDAGTINVYRNKGDLSTAIFDSDLDQFPNLKNIGQINTSGQNSLLGRSSPRIIELDSDTVLVSGSHKGYLYTYKTNLQDPGSQFEKIIMDDWPQWTGGNNRLVFSQGNDGDIRIFSGNIAGGITEHVVVRVPTYSSVVSPTENRLFPNPVLSGQDIHIRLNPEATVEKVHIFGPGGSYYSSFDVESGSCIISTRNWSPGIYFIRINLQNKSSLVHKVVIQ